MDADVFRGGFHAHFFNTEGEYFYETENGLDILKAKATKKIFQRAAKLVFESFPPPLAVEERRRSLKEMPEDDDGAEWLIGLEDLDRLYWEEPDKLSDKLDVFAEQKGLLAPYKISSA